MSAVSSFPVAVQLYTLRELPGSYAEVLAQVAAAGYRAVETVYRPEIPAAEMRQMLQAQDLQVVAGHVGFQFLQADPDGVLQYQRTVGNPRLVVPASPFGGVGQTHAADWQQFGRQLDELGRRCQDAGLRLFYHNHALEMESHDGQRALDWIRQSSDPAHLAFELDLAWAVRGGVDPMTLLADYEGRCPLIHVKDLASAGHDPAEQGWADVGHGTLEWPTLLAAARRAGAEWYIVEHDKPRDPAVSVARSLVYLTALRKLIA